MSGETFWIAVVVEDGRLRLFLDQRQVAQVSDRRITQASAPHIRVWAGNAAMGVIRVVAARVYALP